MAERKWKDEELGNVTKRELVAFLQENGNNEFLHRHKLRGSVKNVSKTSKKPALEAAYKDLFISKDFRSEKDDVEAAAARKKREEEKEKRKADAEAAKKAANAPAKEIEEVTVVEKVKDIQFPENVKKSGLKPATKVHARHILCEKRSKIIQVWDRIKAGEDFAKVAREMSEDKARAGGDLGWIQRSGFEANFVNVAFNCLKPGEISSPFKTKFGYHIVKSEGRK
eukprot:TRINITY_DN4742_c0_g1_i1.p2 TRINITY_DN4742_c0_g1~~TRINITY_DN4742_c0_g1_i1.p2  ORF type:complete len:225 (-),score=72.74 TRINITY_DN4742_c0_g1_i1:69-743(-)